MKTLLIIALLLIPINAYASGSTTIRGRISDDSVREIWIDKTTRALVAIDSATSKTHDGNRYYVSGYDTFDANEAIAFVTTTPDTDTWIHMRFAIQATGATTLNVYKDASADNDGTNILPTNFNANSSNTSVLVVSADPTITDDGTPVYSEAFGYTNTPAQRAPGILTSKAELVLKQDSKYIWYISSDSATNVISYLGYWSECIDKD